MCVAYNSCKCMYKTNLTNIELLQVHKKIGLLFHNNKPTHTINIMQQSSFDYRNRVTQTFGT